MIKIVNEDRNFIYFQVSHIGIRIYSENIVCCELCNLLQSSKKYIWSLLKLWKYFEQIIKQLLNSAFV